MANFTRVVQTLLGNAIVSLFGKDTVREVSRDTALYTDSFRLVVSAAAMVAEWAVLSQYCDRKSDSGRLAMQQVQSIRDNMVSGIGKVYTIKVISYQIYFFLFLNFGHEVAPTQVVSCGYFQLLVVKEDHIRTGHDPMNFAQSAQ